jgi:hypothetical protein
MHGITPFKIAWGTREFLPRNRPTLSGNLSKGHSNSWPGLTPYICLIYRKHRNYSPGKVPGFLTKYKNLFNLKGLNHPDLNYFQNELWVIFRYHNYFKISRIFDMRGIRDLCENPLCHPERSKGSHIFPHL